MGVQDIQHGAIISSMPGICMSISACVDLILVGGYRRLPVPLLDLNDIRAIAGFIHGQLPRRGELARRL